jgi:hypothetical protein
MLAWVVIDRRHLRQSSSLRAQRLSAKLSDSSPLSPIFRIFFQVPYPVSPLRATLTKTPGVYTNNSHSGTLHSQVTTCNSPLYSSSLLSHSCALFCAFLHFPKTQPFSFQAFPHSLQKTRGVEWGPSSHVGSPFSHWPKLANRQRFSRLSIQLSTFNCQPSFMPHSQLATRHSLQSCISVRSGIHVSQFSATHNRGWRCT